ncbi:endonuclease 8-like 3 [Thrips palmi]|uniref:Endonuclease 8-like 3 n=1 Tax=Thrips palmi TaxID=161013 RepID=A0A6P8Z0J3_THRPL|nr:endonuclease 8-like 3 [Thrips palmi]
MVEGPGCKVKGEVMTKKIKGKTIVNVHPGKPEKVCKENSSRFQQFCGHKVSEVRTLGKELFIFFAQISLCIRIHFLMDGSVRYGNNRDKNLQASEPTLTIIFPDEKLTVYKSSVDIRCAEESKEHCDSLADLDINYPLFNFTRAQQRIEQQQSELICDVIMDQTVLPGVGNIIKNEGLFKSGINPTVCVSDLSPKLITCLLHRLRDFSHVFYLCRKNNKPLKNHLCIYEKSKCSQCDNQVTICKPGNLKRLTFFCRVCQVNSNHSTVVSLPKKNSLLGFLQLSGSSSIPTQDWACPHCTFINSSPSLSCNMCLSPKPEDRKRKMSEDPSAGGAATKIMKTETEFKKVHSDGEKNLPAQVASLEDSKLPTPLCQTHKRKTSVKTVRKAGENKGRLFYNCGIRECKFFQWADLHHPLCKHERRTVLRRVLKQNDNNGKEFYSCPLSKAEQCGFFEWA